MEVSDWDPAEQETVIEQKQPEAPQMSSVSDWDPAEANALLAQAGAENVVSSDSATAANVVRLSKKFNSPESEVRDNLPLFQKREERDKHQEALTKAFSLSQYLNENAASAPALRNDIEALSDEEALIEGLNPDLDTYATQDSENNYVPERILEYQANAERDPYRMSSAARGVEAGYLLSELGGRYSELRESGEAPSKEFLKWSNETDARLKELQAVDPSGFIYNASQFLGTMFGVVKEGAKKEAFVPMALSLGAAVVTGGWSALATGLIRSAMFGLGAFGTYQIEGGLSYKDLYQNGVSANEAANISRSVGVINAVIEMAALRYLGALAAPYARGLARHFTSKTVAALQEPTTAAALAGFAAAYAKGISSEVITEVMQEAVTIAGNDIGRYYGGKNKEMTAEELFDELLDVAVMTAKGASVLGLLGVPAALARTAKTQSEADARKQRFIEIGKNMEKVQARETAPEIVAEAVQAQADANNVPTVYIRKYGLEEAMQAIGVTKEQLQAEAPDVVKALDSTKNLSEDIRIPMGFYASRIAPTPLGEALAKHARTSETQKSADEQTMAANAAVQMHAETVKGNAQMAADVINAAVEADAVDNPESKEAKRAASHRKVIENTKKNGRFFEFDSEDKGHVTGQITINPESGRGQFIFKTQDSKWNYDATQEQIDGLGLEGLLGKLFGEGDISNFREKTFAEAYPKEAMRMEGEKLRGRIEKELRDATENKFNTMAYKTQALWGERVARNAAVRFGMKPEDLASYAASIISTKNMPDFESLNTLAERVVRRSGEVEDYSAFKNWQPERTKDGKYLGTPQSVKTPADLVRLRKRLKQLLREGLSGRYWYENSARFVMKLVNNNIKEADKFCKLLAIYSPKNGIWANALEAVRAYTYWKTGGKEEDWKPEKEGGKFSVRMEADDNKAKLVLYHDGDWDGRKTNSFYGNIMYEIVKNNMEECRRLGIPVDEILSGKSTTDLWVLRAFGYDNHSTRDDLGAGLYTFTENETRRLVAELNANLKEGEAPWTAHQVQAAIWSAIKTRSEIKSVKDTTNALSEAAGNVPKDKFGKYQYEKMKPDQKRAHDKIWFDEAMKVDTKEAERITEETQRSFADELERQTNFVTALAVPSVDVGHPINKATPLTKRLFTEDANRIIVDDKGVNALAELLGIALSGVSPQFGVVEGDITPNMISMLTPATRKQESFPKELVSLYAKCLQYIFKQKSVPFFRIENKTMRKSDAPDTMYRVTNKNGHTIKSFERLADAQKFIKEKADKGYILKGSPLVRGVVIKVKQPLNDAIRAAILNEEKRLFGQDIGYTQISENEVIFINFDGENGPTRDHQDFVSSFNEFNIPELEGKSKIWAESINGPVHDWAKDPKGEELLKQIRSDYEEYTRSRGITGRPQKVVSYLDSGKSKFEGILDRYGPERIAFIDNIGSLGLSEEDARNRIERQGEVKQNGSYFQKFVNALPKYVQNALYQIGWHGSPFRFDKFSLRHIGEGEGQQAHGYGLYVALTKFVGERYRNVFAHQKGDYWWTINGVDVTDVPSWSIDNFERSDRFIYQVLNSEMIAEDDLMDVMEVVSRTPEDIQQAARSAREQFERDEDYYVEDIGQLTHEDFQWAINRLKEIEANPESIAAIHNVKKDPYTLYQVEIPDDDVMLFEDKTLANQPIKVKDALIKLLAPYWKAGMLKDLNKGYASDVTDFVNIGIVKGKPLYKELAKILGGPEGASSMLNAVGIKGIRYEGAQDGQCAVLFDDKSIKILQMMQRAYHGSPFVFDRFTLDHMGEGEGAQVHGWGMYFTFSLKRAKQYRNDLTDKYSDLKVTIDGTVLEQELVSMLADFLIVGHFENNEKIIADYIQRGIDILKYRNKEGKKALEERIEKHKDSWSAEEIERMRETANENFKTRERYINFLESIKGKKIEVESKRRDGAVYTVDIPEDEFMLREDKSFLEQSDYVKEAVINLVKEYQDYFFTDNLSKDNNLFHDGRLFYKELVSIKRREGSENPQKDVSLLMLKHGIKGIRYNGRQDGECAVVFDEDAVSILEFFSKHPHELERAKASTEIRGGYNPDLNRIWMTKKADLSTFAHETSHWYLENLLALADSDSASETVKEDAKAILKSFGLKDVLDWRMLDFEQKRKFHEQFAYHSEIYLEEGKAPTKNLEGLFRRFAAFIRDVYKEFKGGAREALGQLFKAEFGEELPELSDEVRRVLDRMIASEEEMKRAEAAEGVAPMFHVKPADMSEQEWTHMQQAWDESGSAAAEKYQQALAKDERWYTKARSALLKEKQKEGKEVRAKIREKVEREVNGRPEVKAFDILYSGGKDFGLDNLKLDPEALRASGLVNELQLAKLRAKGLCRVGGLPPSMTREMMTPFVRFTTDKQMIDALLAATDKEQIIEDETTKRCLEQHSDLFDAKKLDAIITKALHSEQRARAIALELKYLSIDKRLHTRVWLDAAHQAAMKLLATTTIKEATVRKFLASESVMARKAQQAFEAGNRELAFSYKRQQLVHHEAARIAIDAEKGMRALSDLKSRIFKSDKMLAHNYDVNLVAVVRAILTNWGFGRGDNIDGYKYLDKVEKYDEATAQVMRGVLDKYQPKPEEYGGTNLTVADFVSMMTDVKNLMNFAKQSKEFKTDEIRKDLADVVTQLHNRAVKVSPDKFRIGQHEAVSEKEARRKLVMTGKAMLRRVESWCLAMDGGETDGVFSRYIFQPIANAAARYRVRNIDLQKKLLDIVKPMAEKWDKHGAVDAKEIGYTFNRKAELIGALLHTGNRSNYEKLLLGGRGEDAMWASVFVDQAGNEIFDDSKWQAFINRCYAEGIITKEDMDTVQAIWDLLESTKEDLQKAFFDYYGYYFEEVQASEVVTPFGTYRGGYVPAMMDADLVAGRGKQVEQDLFTNESTFLDAIPMNRPGFTHSRTNVHKPLDLNIGMLGSHLQKVVRFAEMAQAVKSVNRVINNELFRSTMNNIDPTIISEMLEPWLRRSALQSVTDPMNGFGKFANRMRTLASMSLMVGNVVNGLQQYTGLSIALTKVKASSLASALFSCTMSPSKNVEYVMNLSPMMKARIKDYAFEYQNQLESISSTKMPTKADEIRDWCQRHGYFIQTFIQKQVDIPVWIAAYNDFIAEGKSEEDAVAHADSVVRTTQTSFDAEAVAKVETGSALWRMILPFYNYFNMQYNLLGERWAMRKQAGQTGKFFLDYVLVLAVPAIIAELIAQAFGGFDDDDDEYDAIDAVRLLTSSQIRNLIAMIPFAGNVINQAGASAARSGVDGVSEVAKLMFGSNPYNSKVLDVPVATFTANVTQAPASLMRFLFAEGTAKKATRDMLDLLTAVSGVPFSAVKKPLGFMAAVANDEANPEDAVDVVRGLVSGKDVNK